MKNTIRLEFNDERYYLSRFPVLCQDDMGLYGDVYDYEWKIKVKLFFFSNQVLDLFYGNVSHIHMIKLT
jgi:hypothetical protein